jgi:hypothetical protein
MRSAVMGDYYTVKNLHLYELEKKQSYLRF